MAMIKKTLRGKTWVRLISQLDVSGDCWEWMGVRTRGGYGQVFIGRLLYTHRLFYQLHNGPIPDGLLVMHSCDNRACCNPLHLRLGTHADNARDMARKGRGNLAKLTPEQVLRIREDPRSHAAVARAYGLHSDTIQMLRNRNTWKDL